MRLRTTSAARALIGGNRLRSLVTSAASALSALWASKAIELVTHRVLGPAALLLGAALCAQTAASETTDAVRLRGKAQIVRLYGTRGSGDPVIVSSGDGGWIHLGPYVAEFLAAKGFFVVGFDAKAYLKSFTSGSTTLQPQNEYARTPEERSACGLWPRASRRRPRSPSPGAFVRTSKSAGRSVRTRNLRATKRTKGPGYDLEPAGGLGTPWMVLHGEVDQVCQPAATRAFVARVPSARLFSLPKVGHGFGVTRNWDAAFVDAYRTISASKTPVDSLSTAPEVQDLALVEIAAGSQGRISDALAVILTGDGGWAELDKRVASGLAANGVPSVGWSSLKYYWTPRTPDEAAADLTRIIKHYISTWKKTRVILVGYSFGADVLPFLVNRMRPDDRARVASVTLLGLSDTAAFEFRVAGWLGGGGDPSRPTAPEVEHLSVPVRCVFGAGEDSGCRRLTGPNVALVEVGRGHHFSGPPR